MSYDNTNSGALFKNDKKGVEARPDYTGSLNVGGVDHWISAWLKTSKDGKKKFMSLSVEPKEAKQESSQAPADDFEDSDIPF